ncbi:putative plc-like phosphodiesterase [Erysiphe necator]|uniref:Putative plc-like phosphodiesterase n=1 Tax=Uncinula necator TaxID=52586 RepID=A0A0B1P9Z0_UNCNE|nr:putative plc-like phosphodiesterase [Erysiphe necator]
MFFFVYFILICHLKFAESQPCNGNEALCSRKYSDVTQIGTHDSAFVGDLPTQNQIYSVSEQLVSGIRFLQAQTHVKDGALQMCHTSCQLEDAGTLLSYLSTIKYFLDMNANEVVTLLLTNGDRTPAASFGMAMESSGLAKYAYVPPKKLAMNEWPTLKELITANTRLVMFLDYGADTSAVPYMLNEFEYFFETAFDITDANFTSCALDRPGGSNGAGLMMLVNHFLDVDLFGGIVIPDREASPRTNAATGPGSIGAHADLCKQTWGRKPNMILIDYFGNGDAMAAQNTLNGF